MRGLTKGCEGGDCNRDALRKVRFVVDGIKEENCTLYSRRIAEGEYYEWKFRGGCKAAWQKACRRL